MIDALTLLSVKRIELSALSLPPSSIPSFVNYIDTLVHFFTDNKAPFKIESSIKIHGLTQSTSVFAIRRSKRKKNNDSFFPQKMSSLRTQSTGGGVLGLSSVGSDRTGATSTAAGSHSHSHRSRHHHHHRSRSAPRAPEKPPRKRHLNPGHSIASIPSQIKLSMLNSGLISFGETLFTNIYNTFRFILLSYLLFYYIFSIYLERSRVGIVVIMIRRE